MHSLSHLSTSKLNKNRRRSQNKFNKKKSEYASQNRTGDIQMAPVRRRTKYVSLQPKSHMDDERLDQYDSSNTKPYCSKSSVSQMKYTTSRIDKLIDEIGDESNMSKFWSNLRECSNNTKNSARDESFIPKHSQSMNPGKTTPFESFGQSLNLKNIKPNAVSENCEKGSKDFLQSVSTVPNSHLLKKGDDWNDKTNLNSNSALYSIISEDVELVRSLHTSKTSNVFDIIKSQKTENQNMKSETDYENLIRYRNGCNDGSLSSTMIDFKNQLKTSDSNLTKSTFHDVANKHFLTINRLKNRTDQKDLKGRNSHVQFKAQDQRTSKKDKVSDELLVSSSDESCFIYATSVTIRKSHHLLCLSLASFPHAFVFCILLANAREVPTKQVIDYITSFNCIKTISSFIKLA